MNKLMIMLTCFLFGIAVFPQDVSINGASVKSYGTAMSYDRNSLTLLLLDFQGERYTNDLETAFMNLHVPDKFNDHMVPTRTLVAPYRHASPGSQSSDFLNTSGSDDHAASIKNTVVNQGITNQVIAKWFGKQPDGTFSDEVLRERGLYNARDGDVMVANASSSKERLIDQGERMIGRTFIVVMDFDWVRSVSEILGGYDDKSKSVASLYKEKNGFTGSGQAYIYQLIWNDSVQSVFYADFWSARNDDPTVIAARGKAFNDARFEVKYLASVPVSGDGTQPNPETFLGKISGQKSRGELFQQLVGNSIDNAIEKAEKKIEDFRIKVRISEKHPIRVKIGLKEGLRVDQRYFVYESVQTDEGVKMKRRGVIRATSRIADNRQAATGISSDEMMSKFYQVAGRRVDVGMNLQQRNDAGLGINLGGIVQTTDYSNYMISAGLEYNISPLLSHIIRRIPHSIKLGVDYSYGTPEYPIEYATLLPEFNPSLVSPGASTSFSLTTTRLSFSLSKDFHFFRVMRFTPFVGYALETAKFSHDLVYYYQHDPGTGEVKYNSIKKDTIYAKINFITAGAKLGINITNFMQLMVWFNALGPDYKGYALDPKKPAIRKNWMETGACLHFEF